MLQFCFQSSWGASTPVQHINEEINGLGGGDNGAKKGKKVPLNASTCRNFISIKIILAESAGGLDLLWSWSLRVNKVAS